MAKRSVYSQKRTAVQDNWEKLRQPYRPRNQQGKLRERVPTKVEETRDRLFKPPRLQTAPVYRQPVTKKPPKYRGLYEYGKGT